VTAAVTEEWLYRGFAIATLQELTGSLAVSASLPLVVFIVLHAPWYSRAHLLYVGIAGALLTGLFLARHDLLANILAHAVIDAVPLLVLPAIARRRAIVSPAPI
jgi:membrane protease YdiL (CAAX protease family)